MELEMELQQQTLAGHRPVFDSLLTQEETLESIVPDSFPDIARIVSAAGKLFIKDMEAGEGLLKVSGSACVTVLYMPEGGEQPKALDVTIPFQCARDCPQIHESCAVHSAAFIPTADARSLNPRKLLIRVDVVIHVTAFDRESHGVTCDVACSPEHALEKQFSNCGDFMIAEVLEKPFLFSDVLRQPASKPAMEELLYYRGELGTVDAKVIGKKLVCKGEILLCALYRSGSSILPARFELPFSQIADLAAGVENSEPEVSIALRGVDCRLQEGELEVTVEALLQAALWAQTSVTLMSDLYCTSCPLDVERTTCTLCSSAERGARRETARQFCESGIPVKQVLDCSIAVTSIASQPVEGGISCAAEVNATVLYLSEDDALCSVSYPISADCQVVCPSDADCRCRCRPMGEATAVPVTGGLEVRFELEFEWTVTREKKLPCVSAVRRGAAPTDSGPRPSVIIRVVGDGESLWDVAKACGSTIKDICGANSLTGEDVEKGTLLLIPTKRG